MRKKGRNSRYWHTYVNYRSFSDIEAPKKCRKTRISLLNNDGIEYSYMNQHMAVCYGRPAVKRTYMNLELQSKVYRNIGIYVEGTSMKIFQYTDFPSDATLLESLHNLEPPKLEDIPDNIFIIVPPFSVKIGKTIFAIYFTLNRYVLLYRKTAFIV